MNAAVRPAVSTDAGGIAAVHVRAWRAAYGGMVPDSLLAGLDERARTDRWQEALRERPGEQFVYVAEVDGAVTGFSVGAPRATPDAYADEGELLAIYVDPHAWRRGLGTVLEAACVDRLRELGFRHAVLWVLRDNTIAREFYEGRGWATDGIDHPHSFGEHGDAPVVCYRRSL